MIIIKKINIFTKTNIKKTVMQKQLLTFLGVLLSGVISAQVGINTTDPKSSLEIQGSLGIKVNTITAATTLDDSYNVVLCNTGSYTVTLPAASTCSGRVYKLKNIDPTSDPITIDGNGADLIEGNATYSLYPYKNTITIISDGTQWHTIESYSDTAVGGISALNCGSATHNGVLAANQAASGVSSEIPYTGGNGGAYSGQTVTSTGVTGLTATLVAGNFATGTGSLTYTITGIPTTAGTASFAISIAGRTCTLTRTVVVVGTITVLTCGSATNNGTLTANISASGVTSVVPYTGGNGGFHNGQTVASTGVTGLTATVTAGVFANGNGSLTYSITGVPSIGNTGTASFALNIGGRICVLTRSVNCSNGSTVVVDVTNPTTGKTWMDRNLGAYQVATTNMDFAGFGDQYQWGRLRDGHQCRISGVTATLSTTDVPGHGNFITTSANPHDWRNPANTNLWQGVSGINNPCPSGYRLPTSAEWTAEHTTWPTQNQTGAFNSVLKLPGTGFRNIDGSIAGIGNDNNYWSSNPAVGIGFANGVGMWGQVSAYGFSVRCIKN